MRIGDTGGNDTARLNTSQAAGGDGDTTDATADLSRGSSPTLPLNLRALAAKRAQRPQLDSASKLWRPPPPFHDRVGGIVSDLDGTIVRTTEKHAQAWMIFFRRNYGIELHPDEPNHFHGSNADIVARKTGRSSLPPEEAEFCTREKEEIFRKLVKKESIDPVPGAPEFFRYAGKRVPLAVVTNSDSENTTLLLDQVGLLKTFHTFVTADHVERPKPEPEGYLLGAESLGVHPRELIAFEDTPGGELAARRAGIRETYVVGETVPRHAFGDVDDGHKRVFGADFTDLYRDLGVIGGIDDSHSD